MISKARLKAAKRVAALHLLASLAIALITAMMVFGAWYPYPYQELSGGRELFLLVVVVDVVCGPLLTLILFNPQKSRREITLDIGLIATIQLAALIYGDWTTWQARPSYLVLEVDRFKVVSTAELDPKAIKELPSYLTPFVFGGVRTVAIRPPKSIEEKNKVLFESIEQGRDYSVRAEFYIPYEGAAALGSLNRAKPLELFLKYYPNCRILAEKISKDESISIAEWNYLPVIGRQDWIALLDKKGMVRGFLPGDGFLE